ncbi:MAG: hypothetical protein OEW18_02760 [Candidatus Aminicenantes bacterium]|nr:hypothetical protein [Candidatus Aminicenantes bacterium]
MDTRRILSAAALIFMIIPSLYSGVGPGESTNIKQVRVTAERASIYIEPSRGSTRIDIVEKGALLNLLQTKKVKDIWYYVSFSSPRYGTRVSGFVQDSAVELVDATIPPVSEPKKAPEKVESRPPIPPPVAPTPAKEEAKPEPQPPPKVKAKLEPPVPPEWSEALVFTQLPKSKSYSSPFKTAPLQELSWKVEEPVPVEEEKTPVKVEAAPPPDKKKEAEPREVPPPSPATKKKEPKTIKPEVEPVKPQTIRPTRTPAPRKSLGRLAFGLGYGASFGGAGACLQLNTGIGIAVHAGAGIFPTTLVYSDSDWVQNKPLWSIGIKYYLPVKSPLFYPYVDIQYGGLRVEAAQVVIGIWDYDYIYSQEQKSLWGPSFLAGVEIRKGRFGICGALGISYVTTSWDFLQNRVSLSFDTSLVVHF